MPERTDPWAIPAAIDHDKVVIRYLITAYTR
jgi:hypothetical protein